ncbi:T9SS type A sorting domain-containing protein [uncultured Algibacter sp.]|uniref:T9SS type A sorting domain-containing protein n=1 Tax=uncultured Algibacter sp. TaxID=298659 RepID=UPI00262BE94B|nr:T9SS type A sorting domain-containing protein [uncultured Algibacter sp.]
MEKRTIYIINKLIVFTYFSFCSFVLSSQEYTFSTRGLNDNNINFYYKTQKLNDGVILSSKVIAKNEEIPVVIKLDTEGNLIWSTANCLADSFAAINSMYFNVFDDNSLYVKIHSTDYDINNRSLESLYNGISNPKVTVVKINLNSGEVVWKNEIQDLESKTGDFVDLDNNKFIFFSNEDDLGKVFTIDKNSGLIETIYDHSIKILDLEADHSGNLVFLDSNGLHKLNGLNFNSFLYSKIYDGHDNISRIFKDKFGEFFLFQDSKSIKINVSNGKEIWRKSGSSQQGITSILDTNDFLYFTTRYAYVGSRNDYYTCSKIDKVSGDLVWYTLNKMSDFGMRQSHSGGNAAALSLDIDCNGDLYMTGYYGDANYGPEALGVMKISGATGEKINDITVTNFPDTFDNISYGNAIYVFNDKVNCFGYLEGDDLSSIPSFINTDLSLENLNVKNINSGYTYKSELVKLEKIGNTICQLRQNGKDVELVKTDASMNEIWTSNISEGFLTTPDKIFISNDFIYVSYVGYDDVKRKLYVAKLSNSTGEILDSVLISEESTNGHYIDFKGIDFVADNQSLYFIYGTDNRYYYREDLAKWNLSTGEVQTKFLKSENKSKFDIFQYEGDLVLSTFDKIYLFSNSEIYTIKKDDLSYTTDVGGNQTTRSFLFNSSLIYRYGITSSTTVSKKQSLKCQYISNLNYVWHSSFIEEGTILKVITDPYDSNYLYSIGTDSEKINYKKINATNGSLIWNITRSLELGYDNPELIDMYYDFGTNSIKAYYSYSKDNDLVVFDESISKYTGDMLSLEKYSNLASNVVNPAFYFFNSEDDIIVGGAMLDNCIDNNYGVIKLISKSNLSVEGIISNNKINIFPNPSSGIVQVSANYPISKIIVYDSFGNVVISKLSSSSTIDMSSLHSGLYMFKIEMVNGYNETKKIIKL